MRKLFYKIKIMPYFCSVQINYNMMYVKTIKILVILCFCSRVAGQEANPLLNMVGKPYAEYHDTFEHVKDSLLWGDSQGRRAAVRLFEEAAAADATGEWDLICRIIKCDARFYESRNGGFIASADYTAVWHFAAWKRFWP